MLSCDTLRWEQGEVGRGMDCALLGSSKALMLLGFPPPVCLLFLHRPP